ncbi:MAG TPA: anti-sigma F factor [Candidatus Anaerotignum merdipullorum]|nr:anti-sigma F factor [Candidatus Anaerotignum merdipullorum]
MKNQMRIFFDAISENESFARLIAAGFFAQLNPTVAQLTDVKTAVSEAVTNAIIHGYEGKGGTVELYCAYDAEKLYIEVADQGVGIGNIPQALEPLYTSKPELERSGMGFTIMETFMDSMQVNSQPGQGTRVYMEKSLMSE